MSLLDHLGQVDNLSDPQPILNSKAAILGVILSFLLLSSVAACGRLWIRMFLTRTPGWDDLFLFLSLLSNIAAGTILCVLGTRDGLGQHFILLGLDGIGRFLRTFYVANGIYPMSTAFIKLALLFQYLRCFGENSPRLRLTTTIVIVIVSLWGFAYTFIAFFPCVPVRAFWDWTIPTADAVRWGYCSHDTTDFVETYIGHAASNMFLDLLVFALPMSLCLQPGVEKRTRKPLVGLFLLGAIVNACSVLRLITLVETKAGTYPTLDPSWYGCTPIVLSALEVHLATICASLPVFWPMIKDVISVCSITVTREIEITRETRDFGDWHLNTYEMDAQKSTEAMVPAAFSRKTAVHVEDVENNLNTDKQSLISPQPSCRSAVSQSGAYMHMMHTRDGTVDAALSFPSQKRWIEHQLIGIDGGRAPKIELDVGKLYQCGVEPREISALW